MVLKYPVMAMEMSRTAIVRDFAFFAMLKILRDEDLVVSFQSALRLSSGAGLQVLAWECG